MSKVYKCDRCGKLFDLPKREKIKGWEYVKYIEMSLDLCTCCKKSLMEWFSKGAERDGR